MRIAFSSEDQNGLDSRISHHFGRCPHYTLVDLDGETVQSVQSIANPFQQHQPGMVPEFIHNQNVNVMVSGGMGRRALDFFAQYGIEVATGADGTVQDALSAYLNGTLNGAQPCRDSVEHEHGHHHHHHGHDHN
jgi:predicted Fe-Mo cluster-binding NifX family protein